MERYTAEIETLLAKLETAVNDIKKSWHNGNRRHAVSRTSAAMRYLNLIGGFIHAEIPVDSEASE